MLGLLADVTPEVFMELVLPLHNHSQQLCFRVVFRLFEEGRIAAEHDVGDYSGRPKVLGSAGLCLGNDLKIIL